MMPTPGSLVRVEPGGPVLSVIGREYMATGGYGFTAHEVADYTGEGRWYPANENGVAVEYELLRGPPKRRRA
jgi:hypothetical protein